MKKYLGYLIPINSNNRTWYRNIVNNKTSIACYFSSNWLPRQLDNGGRIYLSEKNKIYYRGILLKTEKISIRQACNFYSPASLGLNPIPARASTSDLIKLVKNTLKLDNVNANTEIGVIVIQLDSNGPCSNVECKEKVNSKGIYTNNIY
ncbi:hypothetical protein DVW12_17075 [Clostridium botulinum]|nr:hypothetical protein [Clostridium botulinum]